MRLNSLVLFFLLYCLGSNSDPAQVTTIVSEQTHELQTSIPVHDPVMIKHSDTYYLFTTGRGITVWSSKNMRDWQREEPVFATAPEWAVQTIPNFKNHIWAPDISYHKGKYYLYYSVSAFGKNTSAIGLATNSTLNPNDKNFKWVDQGKVIQSIPGKTNWNAIDPNLITDKKGNAYLAFGSFWEGLKMVKLHKDRKSLAQSIKHLPTLASRKTDVTSANNLLGETNVPARAEANAIEAPFIFKKNGYYYLFASIDYCCKGVNSTYKIVVGRAKDVQGPYLDKVSKPMAQGGGTLVLAGDKKWYGVGHSATYTFNNQDFLIFHGYEAADNGNSKLRIEPLDWDEQGWPVVPSNSLPENK